MLYAPLFTSRGPGIVSYIVRFVIDKFTHELFIRPLVKVVIVNSCDSAPPTLQLRPLLYLQLTLSSSYELSVMSTKLKSVMQLL